MWEAKSGDHLGKSMLLEPENCGPDSWAPS